MQNNNRLDFLKLMHEKCTTPEKFRLTRNRLSYFGKKLVFTNGCFDILHRGHVEYLAKAAEQGDFLLVGLNSDASVKQQGKGEDRPVNNEETRGTLLAALMFVDAVIVFDGDTPYDLIKEVQPDVLVKGSDYDANETDEKSKKYIVGSDIVKKRRGEVVTIPLTEGFSTTGLIDKLKK